MKRFKIIIPKEEGSCSAYGKVHSTHDNLETAIIVATMLWDAKTKENKRFYHFVSVEDESGVEYWDGFEKRMRNADGSVAEGI